MNILFTEWARPLEAFGAVHIICIAVMLAAVVFGSLLGKKHRESPKADTLVTVIGLALVALELAKTLFNLKVDGTYDVANIPFQLCSTPLFLLPWIKLLKRGTVKESFLGYCAFYALCGGVFYFVKPTKLLVARYVFLSVQSGMWHILLAFVGFYILFAYDCTRRLSTFCKAAGLFAAALVIAVSVNALCDALCPEAGVNLFWITPHDPTFYPIISLIFKDPKPYPLFLLCFFLYLSIGAFLFFGIGQAFHWKELRKK